MTREEYEEIKRSKTCLQKNGGKFYEEKKITNQENLSTLTAEEAIKRLKEARNTIQPFRYVDEAIDYAIKALEQEPCADTVSRGVFEQVMWERDTAIEQLRELGYELGQKIEKCGAEMR